MRPGNCRLISDINKYPADFKQLDWSEVVDNSDLLVEKALQVKTFQGVHRIAFPIQDEPFLRAIGVKLDYDWRLGIRVEASDLDYDQRVDQLLKLKLDERPIQVLEEAVSRLKLDQEEVLLEVSGMMTIMNAFLSFEEIVLMTRKQADLFKQISQRIEGILRDYLLEVCSWGMDFVYFADAVAGLDIVGPRFFLKHIGPHLLEIFKPISQLKGTHFLLCPRTFRSMVLLDCLVADEAGHFHSTACSAFTLEAPVGPAYQLLVEGR